MSGGLWPLLAVVVVSHRVFAIYHHICDKNVCGIKRLTDTITTDYRYAAPIDLASIAGDIDISFKRAVAKEFDAFFDNYLIARVSNESITTSVIRLHNGLGLLFEAKAQVLIMLQEPDDAK